MTPEQGIAQVEREFRRAFLRLPIIIGNVSVNFILGNFKAQGFNGSSFQPWRKSKPGWGKKPGRSTLIKSGALRRAWRITYVNAEGVAIGNDLPYAKAHNEGLRIGLIQTVKSHQRSITFKDEVSAPGARKAKYTRIKSGSYIVGDYTRRIDQNIPVRKMFGPSPYLDKQWARAATAEIMKEIKTLRP